MNGAGEFRNMPWQTMQRRLAGAVDLEAGRYPSAGNKLYPGWKFGPSNGSWLNRTPSGLDRSRGSA